MVQLENYSAPRPLRSALFNLAWYSVLERRYSDRIPTPGEEPFHRWRLLVYVLSGLVLSSSHLLSTCMVSGSQSTTTVESGIRNLPLILGLVIVSFLTGIGVTLIGYCKALLFLTNAIIV